MTESFADILRHFGARVEIEHENALAQTRAFVQLIRCQAVSYTHLTLPTT